MVIWAAHMRSRDFGLSGKHQFANTIAKQYEANDHVDH
jgi:hypothetical protein